MGCGCLVTCIERRGGGEREREILVRRERHAFVLRTGE
jgi:hypothetical protein